MLDEPESDAASPVATWGRRAGVALVWFAVLVVWRAEILTSPPYFDCANLVFREANFLAETDFDYLRLRNQEPWVNDGGAQAYLVSVIPTFYAVLMRWFDTRTVLLVGHLFSLAATAVVLAMVDALLKPSVSWFGRLLTTLLVVTTPLFSAQADMLGLDMPMTACAMVAGVLAMEQRWGLSALAALAAYLMKETGALVTVSLMALVVLHLAIGASPDQRRRRIVALGLLGAVFVLQYSIHAWSGMGERIRKSPQSEEFLLVTWVICPQLLLASLFALRVPGKLLWRSWRESHTKFVNRRDRAAIVWFWMPKGIDAAVWAAVLMLGVYLAIAFYVRIRAPRYYTLAVPLTAICLVWCGFHFSRWARLCYLFPIVWLGFNLANHSGQFYFQPKTFARHCPERTRGEYLADHRSNIACVEQLVALAGDTPVVACQPFLDFLALPRLGYVQKPLQGYAANEYTLPAFAAPVQLWRDAPREIITLWADNQYAAIAQFSLPHSAKQNLLRDAHRAPLVAQRVVVPGETIEARRRWLLENLWYDPAAYESGRLGPAVRAGLLERAGASEAAIELLQITAERQPSDLIARLELGRMLYQAGRAADAIEAYRQAAELSPGNIEALRGWAASASLAGDWDEARLAWKSLTSADPENAFYRLGFAEALVASATSMDPAGRQATLEQALALCRSATIETLVAQSRAIEGTAHLGLGDKRAASAAFADAWKRDPKQFAAGNNLAWLLAVSPEDDLRDGARAVAIAEQVCAVDKPPSNHLDTLAAAYAEVGRWDDAERALADARRVAEAAGDSAALAQIARHAEAYARKRPWRIEPAAAP